ncbi:hypothetical protein [uncultured Caulobacter sp.]|uniref:hypothetical protein n=1 Tax=uncultured Caulobacter sp. TaxID=158749 RepID=UPI00263A2D33|nr:hypothetical protein [uncultured Caulobacter sp.]
MTTFQWIFAVAAALALAAFLELFGQWLLARIVAGHTAGAGALRAARFVFLAVFVFYSVARTMTPVLDVRIPPLAFLFGLFALWVVVGGLIARRTDRS